MAKPLWNFEVAIKVYEMAKIGMIESNIARAIDMAPATFQSYKKKKPDLKTALALARKFSANRHTLRDHIYRHLSSELRPLWNEINALDAADKGPEKIEAALKKAGKRARQQLFIHAWMMGNYTISKACRLVNMSPITLQAWKKENEFNVLWNELLEHKGNFFEDSFINLVASKDVPATLHAVSTYCRDRGYGKQQAVDVNVSGQLSHAVFDADKLPMDLKKSLLKEIRKQNGKD